jgi:hypothetical protein
MQPRKQTASPQLEMFDQEFGKLYAEEERPGTPSV